MSRIQQLEGQLYDLRCELEEAQSKLATFEQTAQRLCNTIRENSSKPCGDAMTVGAAWAAAQYISGDTGEAPWARMLETIKVEVPK